MSAAKIRGGHEALQRADDRLAELAMLEERNPHLSHSPLHQAEVRFYLRRREQLAGTS